MSNADYIAGCIALVFIGTTIGALVLPDIAIWKILLVSVFTVLAEYVIWGIDWLIWFLYCLFTKNKNG